MTEGMNGRVRQVRAARNQSLFREVNERIAEINEAFDQGLPVRGHEWVCECWDDTCTEHVSLTVPEYERVRGEPTHFLVLPGHFDAHVETKVAQNEGYWVVEKIEDAAAIARLTDPRNG